MEPLSPDLVAGQIYAVLDDIPPHAAKTGALGEASIVEAVATAAERFTFPLVVDPVMISKHGTPLMVEEARDAMRERLVPRAYLLTPNLAEASALTGINVETVEDMEQAAARLHALGAAHVLVKGGHLAGPAVDILFAHGQFHKFAAERIETQHTHGTGCTYSAAITAELAKGASIVAAVSAAKDFITRAIRTNPGFGGGSGPVNHHA